MSLTVQCPACAQQHTVGEAMYGKRAKCACGAVVQVPAGPAYAAVATAPSAAGSVQVQCPSCGKQHMAGPELQGKAVRCPCGGVLQVPAQDPLGSAYDDPLGSSYGGSSVFDDLSQAEMGATAMPPGAYGQSPYGAPPPYGPPAPYGAPPNPYAASQPAQAPRPTDDQLLAGYLKDESWKQPDKYSQSSGESEGGIFSFESGILNAGVVGGLAAMLIGIVWFVGGLACGIIFFYAPVLILLGLVGIIRGVLTSN
ncbi:MAG: hypothetical protein RIC55_20170 [Pirellulaceae bacterium]